MDAHGLLLMMGLVISASITTMLIAERLKIPAIVLLLGAGVLLGPEGLNLVRPEMLGSGLNVIVPLLVAVIVFEGGLVLDLAYLRQVTQVVRNLITFGALITAVLAAVFAHYLVALPWPLAALFGALVSVTGPTVINPLLRRAAVTTKLKTILMAEGVLVDAVGAVMAVVVLEVILAGQGVIEGFTSWATIVATGALIGMAGGWLLGLLLKRVGRAFNAELTRLTSFAGALAIFTLAEAVAHEAGIAAAAAAGIVVGNMRFPHEGEVHRFKGDLTMLGIGVIFVLLAARISFADLAVLGWGGLATVAALIFVVRPICVFASTALTAISWRERFFLAGVGPRGIVAASFATFAALRLEQAGYAGSELLAGLVFMVIIGTVVVQSFTTPVLARLLGVQPMLTIVVGADSLGRTLASHLESCGEEVVLIERDPELASQAREQGLTVFQGDATDERLLRKAGIERTRGLVATTPSDGTNLLVCQLARSRFGITELVARVNDDASLKMFTDLGIRAMSPNGAAVMVLDNLLRRPSTLRLLTDLDAGKEVREVTLHNGRVVGKPIKDLHLEGDVLVALIRRGGKLFVPHGMTTLAAEDQITLIGASAEVTTAAEMFGQHVAAEHVPMAGTAQETRS